MYKIGVFLLLVTLLSIWQLRVFQREGFQYAIWGYTILMSIAAIVGSLELARITIPSPLAPLESVFEPIGKMLLP
ncbi:hypothetical protein [Alicyclobacillus sp. SO9]|uniref:hypothetical protein n=1 Tax=Alicyclobacillus sp. SO9 TaxID=2665646 RepID=UPI0018E8A9A9|nr:hypothetical protein [Alicyclobacillus sp. SO9]QQE78121.1 hypothetical protein GI364_19880 [Alicyclobacillus sp. SO9]